jgi:peroxiredoxin
MGAALSAAPVLTAAGDQEERKPSSSRAATLDYAMLAKHPLRTLDGQAVTLKDYLGEIVVLNFWASWCEPCRKEIPALNGLDTRLRAGGGRVVAVSIDQDMNKARRFASRFEMTMTVCHDGPKGLVSLLDLEEFPFTLVIDPNGNVVHTALGAGDHEVNRVAAVVDDLLERRAATRRAEAGEQG